MTIQLDALNLVTAAAGLIAFFLIAMAAFAKLLLNVYEKRLDEKFSGLTSKLDREAADLQRLERDFLQLKAQLPLDYVRREDFVRTQTVIEAKLDGLALRIENVQLRGNHHAN